MDRYAQALEQCMAEGTYRTLPDISLDGKYIWSGDTRYLNLNSNDYLGLLELPLWQEFLQKEASRYHSSSASSRLLTGNDAPYRAFEELLTEEYGSGSALVWDSGYHANSGIIPVLALPKTLFVADKLVHASIVDGLKLSGAPFQRYRHNDLGHLRQILAKYAADYETVWIVTESLFSMDGDSAPLQELVSLKQEYPHIHLYVDEAHAVGVLGDRGLGLVGQVGLLHEVDVLIGTLGKALGSVGAYSIQSKTLRQLLVSRARPLIFSTALPPVNVAWSKFVFAKVIEMQERRKHLQGLIRAFGEEMGTEYNSQIIPLIVPGEEDVTRAAELLLEHGFYIRPIRKPTVPRGSERLRLSLTAAMTHEEIIEIAKVCKLI